MKKSMKIASVKLLDSGFKGLEVVYQMPDVGLDGKVFVDNFKRDKHRPIRGYMNELFGKLDRHLLRILGLNADDQFNKMRVGVSKVVYDQGGKWSVSGNLAVLGGMKKVHIAGPSVTMEDGYDEYDLVCEVLDSIYVEAADFIEGRSNADMGEVEKRYYNHKGKGEDKAFEDMSDEELQAFREQMSRDLKIEIGDDGMVSLKEDSVVLEHSVEDDDDFAPVVENKIVANLDGNDDEIELPGVKYSSPLLSTAKKKDV